MVDEPARAAPFVSMAALYSYHIVRAFSAFFLLLSLFSRSQSSALPLSTGSARWDRSFYPHHESSKAARAPPEMSGATGSPRVV